MKVSRLEIILACIMWPWIAVRAALGIDVSEWDGLR